MDPRPIPTLEECTQQAVELASRRRALPPFDRFRVFDGSDPAVSWEGRTGCSMPPTSLCRTDELASRFDEYLRSGYAWVNLSILGLFGSDLILYIEHPHEATGVPEGLTSINFSGPTLDPTTMEPIWEINLTLRD